MASTITVPLKTLLMFNEVKTQEAFRVKEQLTHDDFLIFMIKLYKRVSGDTLVLDTAWKRVKEDRGV